MNGRWEAHVPLCTEDDDGTIVKVNPEYDEEEKDIPTPRVGELIDTCQRGLQVEGIAAHIIANVYLCLDSYMSSVHMTMRYWC